MFKKIFRKRKEEKTEILTLSELKLRVQKQIEEREKDISNFIALRLNDLKKDIQNLRSELEKFEPSRLHPRLKGVGSSFKSSTLELWKNVDVENFGEIEKAVEKTAVMKVKYFRLLFGVNPPEIEPVNDELSNIAMKVKAIKDTQNETKIDDLKEILQMIKELENLVKEREALEMKVEKMMKDAEKIDESKDDVEPLKDLSRLKEKLKEIEEEIQNKERNVHTIVAIARKPLRIYSHMTGQKSKKDFDFADEEVALMASKTASEIVKGSIKIKEKQVKSVLSSLECISSGKIKKDMEEIDKLKGEANRIKDEILKMKMKTGREKHKFTKKNLEKEIRIYNERREKAEKEIEESLKDLERKLIDISGQRIKLRL
ncbi:MAG TPA: hypothetical protein EYP30_06870 [Archaeoglobaceae archaeon]|nr:hypothetical protein [Archaeoglobaceae archaeon]